LRAQAGSIGRGGHDRSPHSAAAELADDLITGTMGTTRAMRSFAAVVAPTVISSGSTGRTGSAPLSVIKTDRAGSGPFRVRGELFEREWQAGSFDMLYDRVQLGVREALADEPLE